jgi:hypothetical protein
MRLSCEMSNTDRDVRAVFAGGIKKDLPGERKISIAPQMAVSDEVAVSDASQIPVKASTEVGRRMPRASDDVSVRALKIFDTKAGLVAAEASA